MAHFYSIAKGGRGKPVTKTGHKAAGLESILATWGCAIRTSFWHTDGMDYYRIELLDWPSGKVLREIESGLCHSAIGSAAAHQGDIKPGTAKGE